MNLLKKLMWLLILSVVNLNAIEQTQPQLSRTNASKIKFINNSYLFNKGLILTVSEPIETTNFIATLPKVMCPNITYNGSKNLTYTFSQNPNGMTINDRGCIFWNAPLSEEGTTHSVSIEVSDGNKTKNLSFDIYVSQTRALQTEINNNLVSIVDQNTTLNGVKFRFLNNNPKIPTIRKVESQGLVAVQNGVQILSDYFYADENNTDDIEVLIPISLLPTKESIFDLTIYHYNTQYGWSSAGENLRTKDIDNITYAVMSIGSLKGVMFIGLIPEPKGSVSAQKIQFYYQKQIANPLTISVSDINCTPQSLLGITSYKLQKCTISNISDIAFMVKGFGTKLNKLNMWNPSTSIEQMMVWVGESRSEFDNLGIATFDKNITITLDGANGNLGYVSPNSIEKGKILHLANKNESKNQMHATVAHEYFHHAQAKTTRIFPIGSNIFDYYEEEEQWIIEGSAMWFEDYLYDNLNQYTRYLRQPLSKILEEGLTASTYAQQNYESSLFWKLASEKCKNLELNFKDIFYADFDNNPSIDIVQSVFNNSTCNFGNHLGEEKKSSLASAMLYYEYVTTQENKISLLDSNENDGNFSFEVAKVIPKSVFKYITHYPIVKNKIPAYGANSFKIKYEDINESELFLSIKTDEPLTLVGVRLEKDGTSTITKADNNFHFTTEANRVKKYFLRNEDVQGGLFITLLNATKEEVNILDLNITSRFERDNEHNIVIDHERGLMWQDEANTWLDSWYGAKRHCEALTLGNYNDWRVPSYDELIHILDLDGKNTYRYEIFEHLGPVGYWSLDRNGGIFPDSESAKVVNFGLATWIWINTSQNMNTRCVRTK